VNYSDEFKSIVLGALLHDIGKFWQRADSEVNYQRSKVIGNQTKKNIANICPVFNSNYSHKHALWTNEFFERYHAKIKEQSQIISDLGYDNTANLASYHHNPSTPLQHVIQIADWFSSGMDRIKDPDFDDELKGYTFRKARLKPVFENVSLSDHPLEDQYRYNLLPLEYADNIFPGKKDRLNPKLGDELYKEYNLLWEQFVADLGRIKAVNFYQYMGALLSLLEHYTWCIPSSTNDLPDISLFDHLKTTAAIASCLYDYHKDDTELTTKTIKDKENNKFILFSADLSGIQNYIFDLAHTGIKKLSKILRARSFYLSYLPKMLVNKILVDLNLTSANALMESGGRVMILLPNTDSVRSYLEKLDAEVKKWCVREFYGELTINFSTNVCLCGNDFTPERFREKLIEINQELENKKLTKFDFLTETDFSQNPFVIKDDYDIIIKNNGKVCSITDKKPADTLISEKVGYDISQEAYIQGEIGKLLTRSSVFVFSKEPPKNKNMHCIYFLDGEQAVFLYLFKNKFDALKYPQILDIEQLGQPDKKDIWIKHTHYANHVPVFKPDEYEKYKEYTDKNFSDEDKKELDITTGSIKTFNVIAIPANKINPQNEEDEKRGVEILGILKADVDNLGQIFSRGLKDNRMAISRYSTLSRSINLFFSGYLDQLIEDKYPNIYTVYAGGDDLFMIGQWEDIFNFAQDMNEKFRAFTCWNADIHLSAGIALMKPHQPVRKAAEFAEDQLRIAKQNGKSRLNLFSTSILWDNVKYILEWFKFFNEKYIDKESKIRSGFMYRILQYKRLYDLFDGQSKTDGLIFLSQLSYDLKRNIERQDEKKNIINIEEIRQLQKLQELNGDVPMKMIHIPIILTLYKNRGGK